MKEVKKILSGLIIIILIFLSGFFTNKFTDKKEIPTNNIDTIYIEKPQVKYEFDTITNIDTIAKYLLNTDTIYLTDTIIKLRFDTIISYLNDFDTKRIYDTVFTQNEIKTKFRAEVYRNRLTSYSFKNKNLKECDLRHIYAGGSVIIQKNPKLLINLGYEKKNNFYYLGANNSTLQLGYLRKF